MGVRAGEHKGAGVESEDGGGEVRGFGEGGVGERENGSEGAVARRDRERVGEARPNEYRSLRPEPRRRRGGVEKPPWSPACLIGDAGAEEISRLTTFARNDQQRAGEALLEESKSLRPKSRRMEGHSGEASSEIGGPDRCRPDSWRSPNACGAPFPTSSGTRAGRGSRLFPTVVEIRSTGSTSDRQGRTVP